MCSLCRSMQKKAMMLLVVLGEVDLKEEERGRRGSAGSYLLSMSRMMSTDTSSLNDPRLNLLRHLYSSHNGGPLFTHATQIVVLKHCRNI